MYKKKTKTIVQKNDFTSRLDTNASSRRNQRDFHRPRRIHSFEWTSSVSLSFCLRMVEYVVLSPWSTSSVAAIVAEQIASRRTRSNPRWNHRHQAPLYKRQRMTRVTLKWTSLTCWQWSSEQSSSSFSSSLVRSLDTAEALGKERHRPLSQPYWSLVCQFQTTFSPSKYLNEREWWGVSLFHQCYWTVLSENEALLIL